MSELNYRSAYERQKEARALAENLLENRSRELFEANQSLQYAYNKLKDQKQQIIHQEKLASIGQLSAGVAHEINNPTAYVKSNINALKEHGNELKIFFEGLDDFVKDFCRQRPGGECTPESQRLIQGIESLKQKSDIAYLMEDLVDIVDECQEGIMRIENIVKGLKDFSKPDQGESELIDISSCIKNTLKLVYNQIRHQMAVEMNFDDNLWVEGQRGALSQVFINLIINASHAVEENGRLDILGKLRGGSVELRFKDNGSGVKPEIATKIFDPFFTTKGSTSGTGLGLSISSSIIKKHGGTLSLMSAPDKGAEFIITLPCARSDGS